MEQFNFDRAPAIINPSESHMALLFLVDTSSSMEGKPIDELNKGLNRFKEQVCKDEQTRNILDVAIVEFNSEWRVVQDWRPIEHMDSVNLIADGATYMMDALEHSIDMVNERSRFYKRSGAVPYKPWIVMISDGAPFDDIDEMAKKINEMAEKEKLAFWSLAVSGADFDVLHKLSGRRVIKLADYNFEKFFDWMNKSMRAVSVSTPGDKKPQGQTLPDNCTLHEIPADLM